MNSIQSLPIEVCKFGGTSLAGTSEVAQVTAIIRSKQASAIVCSAMGGITDLLIHCAEASAHGYKFNPEEAASEFAIRHRQVVEEFIKDGAVRSELLDYIEEKKSELLHICYSLKVVGELTPRILAKVVARGERTISKIIAAILVEQGHRATYIDATDVLVFSGQPPRPDMAACEQRIADRLGGLLAGGTTVVLPGFIAENAKGELVTIGRSGTDYSAALIAAGLRADRVCLYKEVDGLLTADPRYVNNARLVPEMHYSEAAELSHYGANVLHPRTITPLQDLGIPLYLRSTFQPDQEGTRIANDVSPGAYPVRALSAMTQMAMITVGAKSESGVPNLVSRTFAVLQEAGIPVAMTVQASADACIAFLVDQDQAARTLAALEEAFQYESERLRPIEIQSDVALIALVGLGMKGTPGICARAFGALAEQGVNVLAIAQSSRELNISIIVAGSDISRSLDALHREYHLQKLTALAKARASTLGLNLLGFGNIGRTLGKQVLAQQGYFKDKLGFDCQVLSLGDTSGIVVQPGGFPPDALLEQIASKEQKNPLTDSGRSLTIPDYVAELQDKVFTLPGGPDRCDIFVDLTAEETFPLLKEAVGRGLHIVLANKKPLAVPYQDYQDLFKAAQAAGVQVRYEATAGAGLPIFDTLSKLEEVGDQVEEVLGCLSGTLGYIMTEVEDGALFSEAVAKAYRLGYTEPDPRDDLSGMDVARKALIIARNLGIGINIEDIDLEPLYPAEADDPDPATFIENLKNIDDAFSARIAAATAEGKVLRYVASLTGCDGEPKVEVAIKAIPKSSPLGQLRGTDNQITIRTGRYSQNPLIVTGPGAGAEVTAAGVLNDILAIVGNSAPRLH